MKGCEDYSETIHTGLDKELSGSELEEFLAHLTGCVTCRAELEAEESLSSLLHCSRPLYTAPDALRARIIQTAESLHAHVPLRVRMARAFSRPPRRALNRPAFVAAILVIAASSLVVPGIVRQSSANSYIESAIAAHRGLVNGSLPLEVQSGSPSAVTAWFAGKVPFNFRLPSSSERPEVEQVYRLLGGRLVSYKGGYLALVAYQMGQQKISLLVSSSNSAAAAGGEEIRSGGILFHYSREENLNVITWSNHGLTYALVSSLPVSGRQSCLVCHQNLADRAHFSAHRVDQVSLPAPIQFPNQQVLGQMTVMGELTKSEKATLAAHSFKAQLSVRAPAPSVVMKVFLWNAGLWSPAKGRSIAWGGLATKNRRRTCSSTKNQ